MINENFLFPGRTPENNHYMVEGMDEYNEEHVLEILFYQANVISISNYGAVGDPRVSDAKNEEENKKRENFFILSSI